MSELTEKEFQFITIYFTKFGFMGFHLIADINHYMFKHVHWEFEDIIRSLVSKQVLSVSPDGLKVRFTDYGLELYEILKKEQQEWEEGGAVRISLIGADEAVIGPGEYFKANRLVRELLAQARRSVDILDVAVGADIFDLIFDANHKVRVRIITSDQISRGVAANYDAYARQFQNIEMKVLPFTEGHFKDIVMLLDDTSGFLFERPIKDMGGRSARVRPCPNVPEFQARFEQLWNNRSPEARHTEETR